MKMVLWNVRLLEGLGSPAGPSMVVEIDGPRIASISNLPSGSTAPPGARDLGGRVLLPGLIDAHCHFMSDLDRSPGFGPPRHRHGERPRRRELGYFVLAASAQAILRSGFTTIRDVGSYDDEALITRDAIALGIVPGPRVFTCGRIISASSPGGAIFGTMYRQADGPWEMRKAVREQLRVGADFIKFMATGARSVVDEDPEPAQMTAEEMHAIVEEAHRMGVRVAAHAEGLTGVKLAVDAGVDTVEHGLSLHREPKLLESMAEQGTVLVPTLTTFHDLADRFSDEFATRLVEQAKRQLEEAYLTVEAARKAEVTIALGYDSGPPGTAAQELTRLVASGMSGAEALRAATAGGGAAIGRNDIGTISHGAQADLVAVDGRPEEDPGLLTKLDQIELVIKEGKVVE